MKRMKGHKIKQEIPESSTSRFRDQKEHDLAYYIHDRVELMHQVFSVIKPKELKTLAPECVYHISIDDLQELCTEELLGISSKRLCAILDGADPPTDTESSSSEHLETISLDSISSDDEVLSQHSSKKKHKHKKHKSKSKHKRKSSKSSDKDQEGRIEEEDRSKASRAGLTVLELLELQARARAIRAQLQQDNAQAASSQPQQTESKATNETSEDEVEIKEEPAEVVEISSEDEKPRIEDLPVKPPSDDQIPGQSKSVTKKVNNLIVTVPQAKQTKKIVLKRSKTVTTTNVSNNSNEITKQKDQTSLDAAPKSKTSNKETTTKTSTHETIISSKAIDNIQSKTINNKTRLKKKQKKKDKKPDKEEDHDEITLQLSDTEKMDLLEDLDRKNYENFTSSSEDSESSSESEDTSETTQDSSMISQDYATKMCPENDSEANTINSLENTEPIEKVSAICEKAIDNKSEEEISLNGSSKHPESNDHKENEEPTVRTNISDTNCKSPTEISSIGTDENTSQDKNCILEANTNRSPIKYSRDDTSIEIDTYKSTNVNVETCKTNEREDFINENSNEKDVGLQSKEIQLKNDNLDEIESKEPQHAMQSGVVEVDSTEAIQLSSENSNKHVVNTKGNDNSVDKVYENKTKIMDKNDSIESIEEGEITSTNKELSEGEITDNEELGEDKTISHKPSNKSEVVCVSDEEMDKPKKKKKKDKKSKKEKKSKKSKSDFREGADQNFYREDENMVIILEEPDINLKQINTNTVIEVDVHDEREKHDIVVIPEDTEPNHHMSESIKVSNKLDDVVSLDDDDDIYEILEISDDSSCYEVEGISVSKEPTAAEIEALSAKIDEINADDVIIINGEEEEEEIAVNEEVLRENNENIEVENMSWRDRYLGSKKVKRVLTTSNILNALRKKNKELKRKLEESKKKIQEVTEDDKQVLDEISDFVEGSIEHFNTLQGSTKYVDPVVPEVPKENNKEDKNNEGQETEVGIKEVTKEMEKDAKQLLKMYKRLLKYNDMNKKKDPNKKKKKKHKKNKEKAEASKEK